MMALVSNYSNGSFYAGRWFCGCGLEALWKSSTTEHSKGEKFAACQKPRNQRCGFFLAGHDDSSARVEKHSDEPPCPQTPTRQQGSGPPPSLLTPETGTHVSKKLFVTGSSRNGRVQNTDDSPTPNRFRANEDEDLPSLILGLLQQDGLALKSSTKSAIQHIIRDRLAGYEAKLQNSTDSLEKAFEKIDELENSGSPSVS